MKTKNITGSVVFGVLVILASHLRADPYASDNFSSYSVGSTFSSTASSNSGSGFGSGWSLQSFNGGAGTATVVSGLTLSGVSTSGNALQISTTESGASTDAGVTLNRAFGQTVPTSGNLWGSYTFSQVSAAPYNGYYHIAPQSGTQFIIGNDANRQYFANAVDDSPYSSNDYADLGVYKNTNASGTYPGAGGTLTLGQTYFVVFDFQNIGYGAYTNNDTTANLWVLDQADLNSIGGDFTVANLNTYHQVALSYDAGAGAETYGTTVVNPSAVFSLVGAAGTADFGNVTLGSTLGDVAQSDSTSVPEPSVSALLIGGVLSLVAILRRRSRAAQG